MVYTTENYRLEFGNGMTEETTLWSLEMAVKNRDIDQA
jgi:hypothetical protein